MRGAPGHRAGNENGVKPPPRLLVAVTHPLTASVLLRGQLSALRDAGFEVGLVVGHGPGLDEVARREDSAVFPIPMERRIRPLADLRGLAAMDRVLRQFRPTIVSAGTPKAGLLGMVAAASRRVPGRVYVLRGLPLETCRGAMRRVLVATERLTASCAHKIVCVSESLKSRAVALGLLSPDKATVLGLGSSNGVDIGRFTPPSTKEKDLARRKFGIPAVAPVIGFVGRLTRDKGIAELSKTFLEDVVPRFPDCRLLLVGGFEGGDPVQYGVRRRLEEHPSVHNIGFSDEPELAYRAMDVLAFPSCREGFPNAPLEAASSSIPVAGYAATGTVDAVVDGETGTLVDVGDRKALAAALIRYLENPDLCIAHGAAGRERAVREFRRELVWQRWIEFYKELLAERGIEVPT